LSIPQGIILIKWDNEVGPVGLVIYPDSLKIPNNLLTQIYSSHRYASTKPGFSSLVLKNQKIVSFYSGRGEKYIEVEDHVIAIVLRRDEDINKYREILNKIASEVLSNIENQGYKKIIPKLYEDLSKV
jgi:hypothetical protein